MVILSSRPEEALVKIRASAPSEPDAGKVLFSGFIMVAGEHADQIENRLGKPSTSKLPPDAERSFGGRISARACKMPP